jgi:hypothetical protein
MQELNQEQELRCDQDCGKVPRRLETQSSWSSFSKRLNVPPNELNKENLLTCVKNQRFQKLFRLPRSEELLCRQYSNPRQECSDIYSTRDWM